MSAPQGLFYWNGVRAQLSASYSLTAGVLPSICTMMIAPQQSNFAADGTLAIVYGGTRIEFPDCCVGDVQLTRDNSGREMWALHILDGRWKWGYGTISGFYNRRDKDDKIEKIDPTSAKHARELADLLFEAMGVKKADTSVLPKDAFPLKDWDYDNAASELESLLEEFGCRVTYGPKGYVKVDRVGVGQQLPKDGMLDDSLGIDPAERPDELEFVGGKNLYNWSFDLKPVGKDVDGEWREINELSYKPNGGWQITDQPDFMRVDEGQQFSRNRDLARETVYRCWQIDLSKKKPLTIYGHKVEELRQILPITDRQVIKASFVGQKERHQELPAWVWGQFYTCKEFNRNNIETMVGDVKDDLRSLYTEGFSINTELGIVTFSGTMYRANPKYPANLQADPLILPDIKLRVAVGIRDKDTRGWIHEKVTRKLPGGKRGTKPKTIKKSDLEFKKWTEKGAEKTNKEEFEAMAMFYLDAEELRLALNTPGTRTYAGFVPITPDGAIAQIRYWVSDDGRAYTQASRNTERPGLGLTYNEKRFYQRSASIVKEYRDWTEGIKAAQAAGRMRGVREQV